MERVCHQVNLQSSLGGGEIYTRFFTRALERLGWRSVLYVSPQARFWEALDVPGERRAVGGEDELALALAGERRLVVTHTVASEALARELAQGHLLAGFAHMPLYEREPRGLSMYHRVFGVSQHVIDSARSKGLSNVHDEPLYGVADLSARGPGSGIAARSAYDWDLRKGRDRILSLVERLLPALFASGRPFTSVAGALTLGIVSRLTPIKQFPLLFDTLAGVIARHPRVRLEVFGAGGYASVRDLRRSLAPCRAQVRFWGHQPDVRAVYGVVDYVLSGLPEKEALGLNLIEAQACGTPVIAVRSPPFTETVEDGRTGFLYEDPRGDGGRSFSALLDRVERAARPEPRDAAAHLERFSEAAFRARVARALSALGE